MFLFYKKRYLSKKRMIVDREFIIHPYLVDNDLKKKKKQPKYVIEGKLVPLTKGTKELTGDWMFMRVCREGGRKKRIVHIKELNCRFLHHQDPYLKMGPFKVPSLQI